MKKKRCNKPIGIASGFKDNDNNWIWKKVKWKKCNHCGMWHSNRFIPNVFWNQNWIVKENRQKVGIIVIRDKKEIWMTQCYHNCYGPPKGEREENETIKECALREFKEETGMKSFNYNLRDSLTTKIEDVEYIFYIVHVPKEFEILTNPTDDVEITSYGWMNIKNLHKYKLSQAIKQIFFLLEDSK